MDEIIRVECQTVRFFDGLEVDGYRMPSGDFRVGLTGASLVLGYGENWLRRVQASQWYGIECVAGVGFYGNKSRKWYAKPFGALDPRERSG